MLLYFEYWCVRIVINQGGFMTKKVKAVNEIEYLMILEEMRKELIVELNLKDKWFNKVRIEDLDVTKENKYIRRRVKKSK